MMDRFSVVLTDEAHQQLINHLIRDDGQEDLCFATYVPGKGKNRFTGIISSIILPLDGERNVHGNVSFTSEYFERVIRIAVERKEGIVFLHSHPYPGWQGMSMDDIKAEKRMSPAMFAATHLPLLGMTLGIDGAWSARFWNKNVSKKRFYNRNWCENVRVIGKKTTITFNDNLIPPIFDTEKQLRTISAWGKKNQENLSRLRVGIVGLGSVGSIVTEILARTGVSNFTLVDFDTVELKNLDRLTNIFKSDIGRSKVEAIRDAILRSASAPNAEINICEYSVCEEQGFKTALDCDILFCCVDRPWPRQVLNFISYAYLIPVVDGGILVRTNNLNTKIKGADWKAQTIGYKRACLECLGQYKTDQANLEKTGLWDDPTYFQQLSEDIKFDTHENVYAFSSYLASMEVLQLLSLFFAPSGVADIGQQMHHFVTGKTDINEGEKCQPNCFFPSVTGAGDFSGIIVYGKHKAAEVERSKRK